MHPLTCLLHRRCAHGAAALCHVGTHTPPTPLHIALIAPPCARFGGVTDMPGWLSLLCGVAVLVAAAYLLYVVLRPEDF